MVWWHCTNCLQPAFRQAPYQRDQRNMTCRKVIFNLWHSRQLNRDCIICAAISACWAKAAIQWQTQLLQDWTVLISTCNVLHNECGTFLLVYAQTAHGGRQQHAYIVMSNSTHISSLTPAAVVPNRVLGHAGAVSLVIPTGQNQ